MTEKLYYSDSHMSEFTARVVSVEAAGEKWKTVLDRTAFFPEGGGQAADTGFIGNVRVLDVQEENGEIYHYTDTAPTVGEEYECRIDWEQRYRRMQNHSGEHIVSGLIYKKHGFSNVGFHMGEDCMTIDLSGELTWDELMEIERLANECVRANVPIKAWFPDSETLSKLDYRSKIEILGDVRIVEVTGVDMCACCAPHVSNTGEVGLVKLLDAMRHRGGVRVTLACGMDALDMMNVYQRNITAISGALSAKRENAAAYVEKSLSDTQKLKEKLSKLSLRCAELTAAQYPACNGNICVFDDALDDVSLRELANLLADKCGGMAAVFSGEDGTYKYIICSRHVDLRKISRDINSAISGRGGGKSEMIQGSAAGSREDIEKYFE